MVGDIVMEVLVWASVGDIVIIIPRGMEDTDMAIITHIGVDTIMDIMMDITMGTMLPHIAIITIIVMMELIAITMDTEMTNLQIMWEVTQVRVAI